MFKVRNLVVFCFIITITSCSGLSKTTKKEEITIIPFENKVVKLTTSEGVMILDLYNETPKHKENFLKLVEDGFYDSLLFHRVIQNFMIQGGDPNSKGASSSTSLGSGGPGYTIDAEFNTKFIHKKGALSAARQGDQVNPQKKSSGSQFYIVQGKKYMPNELTAHPGFAYTDEQKKIYQEIGGTPFLDQSYTVFGEVIFGLEVIDKIAAVKTARGDRPLTDVFMEMDIVDKTKIPELNSTK